MNLFKAYIRQKKIKFYYKSRYYKSNFYDFFKRYQVINKFEQYFITQTPIIFKGKIEFGMSQKDTYSVLGKPRFITKYNNLNNYQIIYYKNSVMTLKNRSQLHFFSDRFFYGIQTFPYLTAHQKQELLNLLKIKYDIPMSAEFPIKIKDKKENCIYVSDFINFNLEYISGNKLIINPVLKAFSKYEKKLLIKKETEKKLIIDIL